MALWPLAPLFVLWVLVNREPGPGDITDDTLEDQGEGDTSGPDYLVELCYEIEGYEYQVYEILRPDGTSHQEGRDPYYFIGTAPDVTTTIQNNSSDGFANYNTKQKAINALTSMWESENAPDAPTGPTGPTEPGSGGGGSEPPSTPGGGGPAFTETGGEEGATMEELDVTLYDRADPADMYSTNKTGTVKSSTDLGGSI